MGTVVANRYAILELLGVGGMGAVYRARHRPLGTDVALKMVHIKFAANRDIAGRFEREARSAAALKHPGIVRVTDLGRDTEGTPYLEMELLFGRGVDALIREGEVSIERAIGIAVQALDALAYAHENGVIHRDIKPENLFVVSSVDGRDKLKIVDFGIAKAVMEDNLTQTGSLLGTPLYMSPEQLTDAKHVTPASDVYSMGATIFELLTGRTPVKASALPEVVSKVLAGEIEREPGRLRRAVPRWLDMIVQRSLARNPAERYADARVMGHAFARALSGNSGFEAGALAVTPDPERRPPNHPPVSPKALTAPTVPPIVAADPVAQVASPIDETPSSRKRRLPMVVGGIVIAAIGTFVVTRFEQDDGPNVEKARLQLGILGENARAFFKVHGTFPMGKTEPTPAQKCCLLRDKTCEATTDWQESDLWVALAFKISEPTQFQYTYQSSGQSFTATATTGGCDDDWTRTLTLIGSHRDGNVTLEMHR